MACEHQPDALVLDRDFFERMFDRRNPHNHRQPANTATDIAETVFAAFAAATDTVDEAWQDQFDERMAKLIAEDTGWIERLRYIHLRATHLAAQPSRT